LVRVALDRGKCVAIIRVERPAALLALAADRVVREQRHDRP
jgi:hypothetical protein